MAFVNETAILMDSAPPETTPVRVLIIEDEQRIARNIARALADSADYAVDISRDGIDGRHMARTNPYDLIILDLMLPGLPGEDLLTQLRSEGVATPVLVLTARDTTDDIIRGLERGADDYLTKPFEVGELLARCKALIRRGYHRPNPVLTVGTITIDTATRTVACGKNTHRLPAMEYRLLEYLAMRAGEVVSKEDILEHLYDFDAEKFSNVIEVYISALRKRLGPDAITTLRGQGYILEGRRK